MSGFLTYKPQNKFLKIKIYFYQRIKKLKKYQDFFKFQKFIYSFQ